MLQGEDPNSSSPALGQGNSPNKRQRLTPPNEFPISNQIAGQGHPPNGMHAAQQQANFAPFPNPAAAAQFLKSQNMQIPPGSSQQDVVHLARQVWHNQTPNKQQLTSYKQNLVVQQSQVHLLLINKPRSRLIHLVFPEE